MLQENTPGVLLECALIMTQYVLKAKANSRDS